MSRFGLPALTAVPEKIHNTEKGESGDDCYNRGDDLDSRPPLQAVGDLFDAMRQDRDKKTIFPHLLGLLHYRTSNH